MMIFYKTLCKPEFFTLLIAIILLATLKSRAKYQAKKRRDEERELIKWKINEEKGLLKWQTELEQKASKLHKEERY